MAEIAKELLKLKYKILNIKKYQKKEFDSPLLKEVFSTNENNNIDNPYKILKKMYDDIIIKENDTINDYIIKRSINKLFDITNNQDILTDNENEELIDIVNSLLNINETLKKGYSLNLENNDILFVEIKELLISEVKRIDNFLLKVLSITLDNTVEQTFNNNFDKDYEYLIELNNNGKLTSLRENLKSINELNREFKRKI